MILYFNRKGKMGTATITFECWGKELDKVIELDPRSDKRDRIVAFNENDPMQSALHKIFCSCGKFYYQRANGTMGECFYPECPERDRCIYRSPLFNMRDHFDTLYPEKEKEPSFFDDGAEEKESIRSKINSATAEWNEFYAKEKEAIELFRWKQIYGPRAPEAEAVCDA